MGLMDGPVILVGLLGLVAFATFGGVFAEFLETWRADSVSDMPIQPDSAERRIYDAAANDPDASLLEKILNFFRLVGAGYIIGGGSGN